MRLTEMFGLTTLAAALAAPAVHGQLAAPLPPGVKAVWDLDVAERLVTPTRERVCLNGLWRWQPARDDSAVPPTSQWGWFKVPGAWPGITDWMQKDCQTVYPHPTWQRENLATLTAAWYEREITVPPEWTGRRIALALRLLNSYAAVHLDGARVGELRFPGGELELPDCRPGRTHRLSLLVVAMPLAGVMMSYNDTASARQVRGTVARRGLCGDVYLHGTPAGPHLDDVRLETSVRRGEITVDAALAAPAAGGRYILRATVDDGERPAAEFTSPPFGAGDLERSRWRFTAPWRPERWWDLHTPQNTYRLSLTLLDEGGRTLDVALPVRFGFRELWIDGRDFYLNGTRLYLCALPLDNAQIGAAWATYEAAAESLRRLKSLGINFVYTHNYGCEPGAHLDFEEILRAADDVGMLVALSQPHFGHYDWKAEDADRTNGYADHAAHYCRVAGSHPSVVAYATSHNATGYSEDMNPDLIDGIHDARSTWAQNNVRLARRAEAIITSLDSSRIVYHHSSGNLGTMHTVNFYPNFVPIQELNDWFEHWATAGVKPVFLCEYGAPFTWDWAMYRGWYRGQRQFGSAVVPWDFCLAEWNAQFVGDAAYAISDEEKTNLRWEAERYRSGQPWRRWDYPHQLGSTDFAERYPVHAAYLTANWRAFRTWGVSAISPWEHNILYRLRPGLDRNRRVDLPTDWEHLQRSGFSPDYLEQRFERMDTAYEPSDWVATPAAEALLRNNQPLLAYLAGKPAAFTSQDHIFYPGERIEKQWIVINNSRRTVRADCSWRFSLPEPAADSRAVELPTGEQVRIPLRFDLPAELPPGAYRLEGMVVFDNGETQSDRFEVRVVARPTPPRLPGRVALFDPVGDSAALLRRLGIEYTPVDATADLAGVDLLIIGRSALTPDGPAPDLRRVREGLKVLVFEQGGPALEQRLGFRITEYGLRQVFPRIAEHPALAGLDQELLRDWRGEATLLPPRLEYQPSRRYAEAPSVTWCGLEVTRLWRCGNRGNVASVSIEKPARGDFVPLVDGGFSQQYSPLLEYREGRGVVLFCQLDVTGRSELEPAAEQIVRNVLDYLAAWTAPPRRRAVYVGGPDVREHLEAAGVLPAPLPDGPLAADDVLVVGREGGPALATRRDDVARWFAAGGHLLALGLDQDEANAFLPEPVSMVRAEHIAASFGPFGATSPFAGVAPADVHHRAPRELPLVTGGATPVGDGVLAVSADGRVVFVQLVPTDVSRAAGAPPALTVTDESAPDGKRCAKVTVGTAPYAQLGQKVAAGEVGRTYTFAALVQPLRRPLRARLEVERAGRPWDRAVRGPDEELAPGRWTELHVTFTVDKPYPEGWQAYLNVLDEGARLWADRFRLYEGAYDARGNADGNLFANPSFEDGAEPWWLQVPLEQQNLRKTYRRTSCLLTRVLANLGVAGATPLLERFAQPLVATTGPSILRNGEFATDADGDGVADEWSVSGSRAPALATVREAVGEPETGWAQVIGCPTVANGEPPSVMLAQHGIAMEAGRWYRLSLRARGEGIGSDGVAVTVMNTNGWRSLFEYLRFQPGDEWKTHTWLITPNASAAETTRFQIWFTGGGKLWVTAVRCEPVADPAAGRWLEGLYLDQPQEWDDPYRFFRW